MLIFERSREGRSAGAQQVETRSAIEALAPEMEAFLRAEPAKLPGVSELEVVRHYTNLSAKNFAIDRQFYPLGSCTMKYNPRCSGCRKLSGFFESSPVST